MTYQQFPPFAWWFTGLPASGKTTLAKRVQACLAECGIHSVLLDSDELRHILTPKPNYDQAERDWFYAVLADLATWLTQNGVNVLIAATATKRAYRDRARRQIANFSEIYVRCPLEVCQRRDPKGIYAAAKAGEAPHAPGLGDPYEPPLAPEAIFDNDFEAESGTVNKQIEEFLAQRLCNNRPLPNTPGSPLPPPSSPLR